MRKADDGVEWLCSVGFAAGSAGQVREGACDVGPENVGRGREGGTVEEFGGVEDA